VINYSILMWQIFKILPLTYTLENLHWAIINIATHLKCITTVPCQTL